MVELRRLLIAAAIMFLASGSRAGAADLDLARSECAQAAQAYTAGDFGEAARLYQAALDHGLDAAVVHYNLGNARFKEGQLGEAIASYLRAARIDPRDEGIRTNLARARAQIRDLDLSGHDLPPVLRPFQWGYGLFSANEWLRLAALLWVLFLGIGIFLHWRPERGPTLRRPANALLGLALVAFLVGGLRHHRDFGVQRAVVVSEEVEVRSGPGSDYNLAFRVHEGLPLEVNEDRGEWLRIDLGGELVGWVPAYTLERL